MSFGGEILKVIGDCKMWSKSVDTFPRDRLSHLPCCLAKGRGDTNLLMPPSKLASLCLALRSWAVKVSQGFLGDITALTAIHNSGSEVKF